VTETIQYESFDAEQQAEAPAQNGAGGDLSRLGSIPMELSVELGRTHMTVAQTLELRPGAVVMLERAAGSAADLLVNGSPIARGEVVVVDEQYALRIGEILDGGRAETAPDGGAGASDGDGAGGPDGAATAPAAEG